MTKLEAVKLMFQLCGKLAPPALDTGGASAAAKAERVLDEVDREIQAEGWQQNTDRDYPLDPNGSDEIPVPADALSIDTDERSAAVNVAVRSGKLYDLDNRVSTFTGTLYCRIVRKLTFSDLIEPLARCIAGEAALRFYRQEPATTQDRQTLQFLIAEAGRYRGRANREANRTADVNLLTTAHARRVKGRDRTFFTQE